MIIDVSNIFRGLESILSVDCSVDKKFLDGYFDNVYFYEPINVNGVFTNVGSKLNFTGIIDAKLSLCCDRCLKDVHFDFNIHVNELFVNSYDAGEAIFFDGNTVDLSEVVASNIIMNLPMKVLCSDDCRGLCPVCGVDLNNGECNCDTSYFNPHFESLRFLFDKHCQSPHA